MCFSLPKPERCHLQQESSLLGNLQVRIHQIFERNLVDQPCAMGISVSFSRQPCIYVTTSPPASLLQHHPNLTPALTLGPNRFICKAGMFNTWCKSD
jgi:hypothetical protein